MTRLGFAGLGVVLLLIGSIGCGAEVAVTSIPAPAVATRTASEAAEPAPVRATEGPVTEPEATPTPIGRSVTPQAEATELTLSTEAFGPHGTIPEEYSCFGDNISPPLNWSGVGGGTKSLVLIVHDPDSRPPGFVHWVVYNMPPEVGGLPEGVPPDATLASGMLQGKNDFAEFGSGVFPGGSAIHQVGYDGPCPPGGEHRYVFTLYALDTTLALPAEATASEVTAAMEGHILAQAELIGLYTAP